MTGAAGTSGTGVHVATLRVDPEHPAFAGHFPGQPLLPGAALLAEVLEVALADPRLLARVGTAPRIAAAKFLAPVRPGAHLTIQWVESERQLRFEVREGARLAAAGQFDAAGTA